MKILIVSSYLPYPLFSGGHIRLYNLLKHLSEKNIITLVCEKREYQTREDVREVEKICERVITFPRKKQWSLNTIIKTGFSNSSFLITGHKNFKMRDEIEKLLSNEKFDLIHVETFYVMQNLPHVSIPIVLAEHNIEYLVYKRYKDNALFLLNPLLNIDILKLKREEEKFWKKADVLIAVSEDEANIMKVSNRNVNIVPNGVDTTNFKFQISNFKLSKDKRALFIGDFKWVQNRDAVNWIIKKIWPLLKSQLISHKLQVKLWIVGKNIPKDIKSLKDKDIIFDENASEDTSRIFQKADLLLAPIRIGGGTSFKILEAMASGVPVVTTRLGIEGIEATDGRDVLIADDLEELVSLVIKLLKDDNLYQEIAKNARKLIEEKYDWEAIAKELENVYRLTTERSK